MEHLFDKLGRYAEGDIYPYHMPGHKRRPWGELPEELYRADITEIDGFDNLHQPEGILLKLQQRAAQLYGAEESYYLINGSTGGILCAVSSALPFGGHILMARNCHRSVYHGAYLRNLKISCLWPPFLEQYDICDAVTPEQVQAALDKEADIGAVIIVSPTYEGRIADVAAIAEVVHEKGLPLIVDEAHGAHLGLAEGFVLNSCQQGADLVIHSVHKTLPSLTQTALLHVNGNRIDRKVLRRFLGIYQSSSPSYLLMAGIDNALQYVEAEGQRAFRRFREQYGEMMRQLSGCRHLIFPEEGQDIGKLLISVKHTNLTGKQLYHILLEKYHLQLEMAAETYALAMFTLNDGEEAYRRMTEALLEIDGTLSKGESGEKAEGSHRHMRRADKNAFLKEGDQKHNSEEDCYGQDLEKSDWKQVLAENELRKDLAENGCISNLAENDNERDLAEKGKGHVQDPSENGLGKETAENHGRRPEAAEIGLSAAWDMPSESVLLQESVGRAMGEFINLYPPGIPLLVPGERMTEALCRKIQKAVEQGLTVQGIETEDRVEFGECNVWVRTLKEDGGIVK